MLGGHFERALQGKRVLVTGHTGFTGGWACLWLAAIAARVSGYALEPDTEPSLFNAANIGRDVESQFGDICDYVRLEEFVRRVRPDAILHLAAQPLVRRSYREPLRTFEVNAQGTANVLDIALRAGCVRAAVCVTTDKVYRGEAALQPYKEDAPLGGSDPYSASKAAAELVIESYRASFGKQDGRGTAIASARGGNIVGGGDWSEDRLVPDFVRAVTGNKRLELRYPEATRPWQHVLGLVQGYLMLLSGLLERPDKHASSWNFGPRDGQSYSVRQVVELLSSRWTRPQVSYADNPVPEASILAIDSSRASRELGWAPPWDTPRALTETAAWYRDYYEHPHDARELTMRQIEQWRAELS